MQQNTGQRQGSHVIKRKDQGKRPPPPRTDRVISADEDEMRIHENFALPKEPFASFAKRKDILKLFA